MPIEKRELLIARLGSLAEECKEDGFTAEASALWFLVGAMHDGSERQLAMWMWRWVKYKKRSIRLKAWLRKTFGKEIDNGKI